MTTFVTGIYTRQESADQGVVALDDAGFAREQVSVVVARRRAPDLPLQPQRSKRAEGAAAGGLFGAIIGGFAAISSLAFPGGIVVTGPIAAAFGGGALGLAGGALLGAVVGTAASERDYQSYGRQLARGSILVSVAANDKDSETLARSILQETGARTITPQERSRAAA
ncbi:MAG TPA: general stress protein [Polyangiaceae bacterium]